VFRLPVADRPRRAALDAEERLFWAIVISLWISLSIVLLLAAAGRYSFERLLLADAAVSVLLAVGARFRLGLGAGARRVGLTCLLPLALAAMGSWRFFPPSEYIIGGKDPGAYINEGVQIAQRGGLTYDDPVIASIPAFARDLFFPSHRREDYYSTRFMGFFIRDPDSGEVVGQFPHLFPASIAIGYGLDGLTGARRTVGVWALLGLLAVYFAGARAMGRAAAFAGAGLLALHVIEVWFARYPNAEVVMQALLFAAMLATARAHVDDDRFFAPVGAALLGLLLFLRFDAVLGIAGVLAGLALLAASGGRLRPAFILVLGLVGALAAAYLLGPMRAYADLPIVFVTNLRWWHYVLLAAAGLLAAAAMAAGARHAALNRLVRTRVPLAIAVVLVALAIYALYFREPAGKLAAHDAHALRTFASFYLTVPVLLAALLGYALEARRSFWRAPELFVTVALFSLFFFYKIRIFPDHFWMARRFLPMILPGVLLFAAAAAFSGMRSGGRLPRIGRSVLGIVFLGLVAAQYARVSRPILEHVEYAGIIPKLEAIASTVHDNDLLVVESREASDTHVLALPLAYIYARNVVVLANRVPDKVVFAGFLDWARTRYARVLFMGGGGTNLLSRQWAVRPLASERFQIPEYDSLRNAYPRSVRRKEFDYSLYEFTPPVPEDPDERFELDVGALDDLHVWRMYAKEQSEGRSIRWSRDTSYVSITRIRPDTRELTLWMSDGGRPDSVPPADVKVYLADQLLGTARVDTGFEAYTLAVPAALAERLGSDSDPVQLKLVTSVWIPEAVLGTPDDRALGVMIDRVAVR
jgi:hypothetical protein